MACSSNSQSLYNLLTYWSLLSFNVDKLKGFPAEHAYCGHGFLKMGLSKLMSAWFQQRNDLISEPCQGFI